MSGDQKHAEETVHEEVEVENKEEMNTDHMEEGQEEQQEKQAEEEETAEQKRIKELEQANQELNNRLLRVYADYENFRRRTREEKEAAAKYRSQSLVEQILPVLDNFERALNIQPSNDEAKSILQGMEMVYRQLLDALKSEGVTEIEAVGKPFDPYFHQAVMQVQEEGYESNIVIEALQKGYMLKDRVIRPTMVKVNA